MRTAPMTPAFDITGRTYGRLEVLGLPRRQPAGQRIFWRCRCACGKRLLVRGKDLKSGNTKSCGSDKCMRVRRPPVPVEIGERFHRLVVLEGAGFMGEYRAFRCECDCGEEIEVQGRLLRAEQVRSCGCMRRTNSGRLQYAEARL